MRVEDLVGTEEVAERIRERVPEGDPLEDCKAMTVHRWRQRFDDFPAPVRSFKMGPVFHWPTVEKWLIKTSRLEE